MERPLSHFMCVFYSSFMCLQVVSIGLMILVGGTGWGSVEEDLYLQYGGVSFHLITFFLLHTSGSHLLHLYKTHAYFTSHSFSSSFSSFSSCHPPHPHPRASWSWLYLRPNQGPPGWVSQGRQVSLGGEAAHCAVSRADWRHDTQANQSTVSPRPQVEPRAREKRGGKTASQGRGKERREEGERAKERGRRGRHRGKIMREGEDGERERRGPNGIEEGRTGGGGGQKGCLTTRDGSVRAGTAWRHVGGLRCARVCVRVCREGRRSSRRGPSSSSSSSCLVSVWEPWVWVSDSTTLMTLSPPPLLAGPALVSTPR